MGFLQSHWVNLLILEWHSQPVLWTTTATYKDRKKRCCWMLVTTTSLCGRENQNGLMFQSGPFTSTFSWGLTEQWVWLVHRPPDSSATFELTPLSDLRHCVIWDQQFCHLWSLARDFLCGGRKKGREREGEKERAGGRKRREWRRER